MATSRKNNKGNPARAVGPWLIDGSLVYRLNQYGTNHEEVRVTRTQGDVHDQHEMHQQALSLQRMLNVRDGYKNPTQVTADDWNASASA